MAVVATPLTMELGSVFQSDRILTTLKKRATTDVDIKQFDGLGNAEGQSDDLVETVTLVQLLSTCATQLDGREVQRCISRELATGKLSDADDAGAANGRSLATVLAQKSAMGWQSLLIAAQRDLGAAAETLLEMGAEVDCEDPQSGWTPLMHAVVNGNERLVKILLANGAQINKFAKDDWNPLSTAIMHERLQIVDVLIDAGACINTIKRRHPCSREQYLHAQWESETRRSAKTSKQAPFALYVRDYDQHV